MGNTIQLVDAISASPTVRLDLNDESKWFCETFLAPPPRLRRASSVNAMRDGINVSSSQYDARTLQLGLRLITTTQDLNATELQKLFRELDRETNVLKYQPNGATKPVFFRLYRSDAADLVDMVAQKAGRVTNIDLLAEPFAYGLREDLSQILFTNAATAVSGALAYQQVTGIIGDVASPIIAWATREPDTSAGWYVVRSDRAPILQEVEGWTNGTDTTTVSSDASLSNSGGKSISFGTPTIAPRMTKTGLTLTARGTYRVVAQVRSSSGSLTCDFELAAIPPAGTGVLQTVLYTTGIPVAGTTNEIVDLGLIRFPEAMVGSTELENGIAELDLYVARSAGSGSLIVDWIGLIPAGDDTESAIIDADYSAGSLATMVLDGILDREYAVDQASPWTAGAVVITTSLIRRSGAYPLLKPNTTNHFVFLRYGVSGISNSTGLLISYWPKYLHVRPSTT